MGCFQSTHANSKYLAEDLTEDQSRANQLKTGTGKGQQPPAKPQGQAQSNSNISNSPATKPRLDPKDFRFVGLRQTVKVKGPGSINGQAFMIDDCQDCDIYILDHCAQVTIDDCKNCRIFIGPTDGSIFLRTSNGCKCAFICRQFRSRDCSSCQIGLLCRSRPIVESSNKMGFACFDMNYQGLSAHLKSAKLSAFHNFWSHIYDFTPSADNWHLLPVDVTASTLIKPFPSEVETLMQTPAENPVVTTLGERQAPFPGYLCIVFAESKADQAKQLVKELGEQACLLRTNQVAMGPEIAAQVALAGKFARSVERDMASGQTIVLEVACTDVHYVQAAAQKLGGYCTQSQEAGSTMRYMGIEG